MSTPSTPVLKALVLAGGKGTRLRPLTYTMAKQLVPVANKPILCYPLESIYSAGIRDIGVIISPETGDAVKAVVNRWCPSDVTITFILQDQPAGLAHAVKIAKDYLQEAPFVMYLGDNLIQNDLKAMVDAFLADSADAYILLKQVENPQAFGVALLNDQKQVITLEEKPKQPKSNLALVGVYLFTPSIFEAIANIQPSARGELEITDAIQYLVTSGKPVKAFEVDGWWLDTGKKDDLLAANRVVLETHCQSHVTGVKMVGPSQINGRVEIAQGTQLINSKIEGPVSIAENCVLENAYIGPYTSIGANTIVRNTQIENSVVLDRCTLSDIPVRVDQSLVGNGCTITKTSGETPYLRFLLSDQAELEL